MKRFLRFLGIFFVPKHILIHLARLNGQDITADGDSCQLTKAIVQRKEKKTNSKWKKRHKNSHFLWKLNILSEQLPAQWRFIHFNSAFVCCLAIQWYSIRNVLISNRWGKKIVRIEFLSDKSHLKTTSFLLWFMRSIIFDVFKFCMINRKKIHFFIIFVFVFVVVVCK